jgi:hypothetical protein
MFNHIPQNQRNCPNTAKRRLNCFRETLDDLITLEIPIKTEINIEEIVENITKAIQRQYGK